MALFGGGGPDHPMADIKQAKKLIAELPASDSVKALEEITFWLDSISRTEGFRTDARFELLELLDQAAKNHQRKVGQDYLSGQRLQKFQENKLWTTAFEFWKLLGASYNQCVEEFQSGASGSGAIKKQLPVIIARALRALTLQLKWLLLRYGPIDDRLWSELGRLYHFAETQRNAMATVEVYPGAHGRSSVRHEFLKAMMLGVSSTDGLNLMEQEIAERAVAHFGSRYVVQDQPGPACAFLFDLSMRKPPSRVQKGARSSGHVRYFGAGEAQKGLAELIAETQRKDGVPSDVNLGGNFETKLVLEVLQHLALYWSDTPPARRSERRKVATRLTVAPGFNELLNAIGPTMNGASLDLLSESEGTESWIVENASEGGYGAIIPQVKGDWIRVGALVGLQTETANFWGAGIIRRITRDEYHQRRVGIQLLSHATIPVSLTPAGNASSINAGRVGDRAVLLSTKPDRHGEVAALLRLGTFAPGQSLDMRVQDKKYRLIPSRLVEGGEDFDWAKFKVIERP
jgi:hypothetical protein